MPFPEATSLIDNFDRASLNPVGEWPRGVYATGAATLQISSNRLTSTTGWTDGRRSENFGPDVAFYMTVATSDQALNPFFFHLRLDDPGYSGWAIGANAGQWRITRGDPGPSFSTLAAAPQTGLVVGDKIGAGAIGNRLSLWHQPGGAGAWNELVWVNDATYNRLGKFGLEVFGNSITYDDLRGGTVGVVDGGRDVIERERDIFLGPGDQFA